MVQLSIVVRPKSAYDRAGAIRKVSVDSSQRLEQILTDLKLPKKGAVLYAHGKELPLNSSLASHNIQDGDVLETCASPNLSAILSAVLHDLNAVEKRVPEEGERTKERIQPLLDGANLVPWPGLDRWTFDSLKHRKIALATMKKALQRDDRYADLQVPVCGDLPELRHFMMDQVWTNYNDDGTPRHRFNNAANLFKPSAKNSNGQPTTCWQLLQKKLEKFWQLATTLPSNVDPIEEFVAAENLRHGKQPATPKQPQTPRSTPRRTNSTSSTPTTALRRIHSTSTPSPSARRLVECTVCKDKPADSLCLDDSCPFFQQASCTMCFHGNHPMNIRDHHERVPWNDPRAKAVMRAQTKAPYCPQFESGPYAILATLFERVQNAQRREYSLEEERLKKLAQARCRSNLYDRQARGRSAFACIEGLTAKNLVRKEIVPGEREKGKFSLLPDGEALAKLCLLFEKACNETLQSKDMGNMLKSSVRSGYNDRKVSLIVDTREDSNYAARLLERCQDAGISGEPRELPAGDYLFTTRKENDDEELVLPLVIERKSWSDLADSVSGQGKGHRRLDCVKIGDGEGRCQRTPCQLCRMKASGCSKVMFIIEGARCLNRDDDAKCNEDRRCQYCRELAERHGPRIVQEALENVLYELQARHNCVILFTRGYNETIDSLQIIHKLLSKCGDLVSDPASQMKPRITYKEFCTNARRRNWNESAENASSLTKNGSVLVWNSNEFVGCVYQGKLLERLSDAFPSCFGSLARRHDDKDSVSKHAPIELLSSDSEPEEFPESQDSVMILDGDGWISSAAARANRNGDIPEKEVILLDDVAPAQATPGPKRNTTSQLGDNRQGDGSQPRLLILRGMLEYDTDFYKDIDKVWKAAVLSYTHAQQSSDSVDRGQLASGFMDLAKTRLQELLALNELPLVKRHSVIFWVLWIQLRTNVLVHFARQSSCKDAVLKNWQGGKQVASLASQSAQRLGAALLPRGDIGIASTRTVASTARAHTATHETTRGLERRDWASKTNDFTTNDAVDVPTCPICMISLRDGEVEATPCAHSFHRSCLQSWFDRSRSRKCPTCNHDGLGAAKDDRGPATPNNVLNRDGSTRHRRRTPVDRGPATPITARNTDDSAQQRRRTPDSRGPATPTNKSRNTDGSARKRRRTMVPTEPSLARPPASLTDAAIREARLRRFGGAESNNARAASSSMTTANIRASGDWDCPKCTFKNEDPLSLCCHVCGATKSPAIAPSSMDTIPRANPSPSSRRSKQPSGRRELFPKWQCKVCTFENDYSALQCDVCKTEFDEGTSQRLPSQTTSTPSVTKPGGRPPLPPPPENFATPRKEIKPRNKSKCGACGAEGHNRGTATEENCDAYFKPEEIELRQKKKEKAESDAREARREAERSRQRAAVIEVEQQQRLEAMQRLVMETRRDAEETQRIRRAEARRQEKAAERAAKRARKYG